MKISLDLCTMFYVIIREKYIFFFFSIKILDQSWKRQMSLFAQCCFQYFKLYKPPARTERTPSLSPSPLSIESQYVSLFGVKIEMSAKSCEIQISSNISSSFIRRWSISPEMNRKKTIRRWWPNFIYNQQPLLPSHSSLGYTIALCSEN